MYTLLQLRFIYLERDKMKKKMHYEKFSLIYHQGLGIQIKNINKLEFYKFKTKSK